MQLVCFPSGCPNFGVSGDAAAPCNLPRARTRPGGEGDLITQRGPDLTPKHHRHGQGCSSRGGQRGNPTITPRNRSAHPLPALRTPRLGPCEPPPSHGQGGDKGPGGHEQELGRGKGAAAPSAQDRKAAEMPKQSSLDGSTRQESFRLVFVRLVVSVPPAHPLLSGHPDPSQNLCSLFYFFVCFGFVLFFFVISVNILNCKCCLVMTIAYGFGRCFFTMHTNILWLLYMNIFNDT